jgi:hypothetical protein
MVLIVKNSGFAYGKEQLSDYKERIVQQVLS